MLDTQEYTTQVDYHQGNGNNNGNGTHIATDYSHLDGDWALFYKVAKGFTHRVKPEDKQDFLHDLLLVMSQVKTKYDSIGKELTEAGLIRVASYEVADYWRKKFRRINGIDCSRCSKEQRRECKNNDLFSECPKAIRLENLDRIIQDGDGSQIELCQLIADDTAIDVIARLDARFTLRGYPHRFIRIAYKKYAGYPLTNNERTYLYRQKNKAKKSLIFV